MYAHTSPPRPDLCRRLAATAAALAIILTSLTAAAQAAWHGELYATLVTRAEAEFDARRYDEAVEFYRGASTMLEEALAAGTIAEPLRADARLEQAVLSYKLAIALEQAGECAEARERLQALSARRRELPPAVVDAVERRLASADSCSPRTTPRGDLVRASTDRARQRTATEPMRGAGERHTAWRRLYAGVLEATATRATLGRCNEAADLLALAGEHANPSVQHAFDETRQAVALRCPSLLESDLAVTADAPSADLDAWMPWLLVSLGAVALSGAVATEVLYQTRRDDYDDAQIGCLDGHAQACNRGLTVADELETLRPIPTTLVATGGVLVVGGLTWWLVDTLSDDDDHALAAPGPDLTLAPQVDPNGGGLILQARW